MRKRNIVPLLVLLLIVLSSCAPTLPGLVAPKSPSPELGRTLGEDDARTARLFNEVGHGFLNQRWYETAEELFRDSMALGNADAYHSLGSMYHYGQLRCDSRCDGDQYDMAESLYIKAIDRGNVAAADDLATLYLYDKKGMTGVERLEKAEPLLIKAANAGYAEAQTTLGYHLYRGDYGNKRRYEGKAWLEKASATNHPRAMYFLGVAERNDGQFVKAETWLTAAAAADYVDAQATLGYHLYRGDFGQDRRVEGRVWLEKAALREDPRSMFLLAMAEVDDARIGIKPVAPAHERAAMLFGRAAKRGYVKAQHGLGLLLIYSHGIPRDIAKGRYWLELAVKNGSEEAKDALRKLNASFPPTRPPYVTQP